MENEALVGKWEMFKDISPFEADWYLSGDTDKEETDWLQPN